jgi:hypothetical protein
MASLSSHPFTSFNKRNECTTRVGNWQEEAVLKALTGQTRCRAGSPARAAAEQQAEGEDAAGSTFRRVIEHSDQLVRGSGLLQQRAAGLSSICIC